MDAASALEFPSRVGIGTARGAEDDRTDEQMVQVLMGAFDRGVRVFDTAGNYRRGRSERAVGEAVRRTRREDSPIVVITKGGYLRAPGGGMQMPPPPEPHHVRDHCLAASCLRHQLELSLATLGLDHIDVYLLHNPEVQMHGRSPAEFDRVLADAFSVLESAAEAGLIGVYGVSTWRAIAGSAFGWSEPALDVERCVAVAQKVAPGSGRFAVLEAPLSMRVQGAIAPRERSHGARLSLLELCARLGIAFVASAAAGGGAVPAMAAASVRWVATVPTVATALVGTLQLEHLDEVLWPTRGECR
jgi:aryl-alcohol dehydrogenase-like predicted oxidoreductase